MSQLNRLTRLTPRVKNLNSIFALPCTRHQTRSISSNHGPRSTIRNSERICGPFLTRPPVACGYPGVTYLQIRTNSTANIKEISMHDIGEGIHEVEIKVWHVKVGDAVKEFDLICEVESDKANAPITSRYEGVIRALHHEVGDKAKVGKPLFDIEIVGSNGAAAADTSKVQQPADSSTVSVGGSHDDARPFDSSEAPNKRVQALPSVRRFAQEMKVDLSQVRATGSRGQVLRDDVLAYLEAARSSQAQGDVRQPPSRDEIRQPSGINAPTAEQTTSVVPLRGVQRAMFKTMTESLKIPHFNYADEIDLTQLVEANAALKAASSSDGQKIANFAFIIKMVSLALQEYPQLNASIDESGENLIYKHYHNIGVAVDTKAGLIVPNIKNVQDLSVEQVNSELLRLRELGYASKLGPADLSGSTFTLSNIGAVGGTFGVPVIVSPEIVIGALGRTRKLPRFNSQNQVEARHIMQIVWSADHRVVDGATLSRFSNLLKHYLEAPYGSLLKLK